MTASPGGERSRDNAFDAIRLVAALAVLVGHAWPLTGTSGVPRIAGLALYEWGVDVFFCLSGYLIATSWARSPRALPFLARRAFRIFPALAVVVLITVFVLGPLFTTLTPAQYFAAPGSWLYLTNLTLAATYTLPGVFEGLPREGVVNGSLWTLGPEFLCYLAVLAIGLAAARLARGGVARLVGFVAAGAALIVLQVVPGLAPAGAGDILRVAVFFAAGAVLAELIGAGRAGVLLRPAVLVPLALAWAVAGALVPRAVATPLAWVVLPVIVVGLGSRAIPVARRAGRFGDFSYGLYLWGFPVQQAVVTLAPQLPLWADVLVVAAVAGALAVASWWLVERRAIGVGRALSRAGERR